MKPTWSARHVRIGPWCIAFLLLMTALGAAPTKPELLKVPSDLQPGEIKFNAVCARCHGSQGSGTTQGPPLVHKIYEPNHHGDAAFQRAALNGVRAHHWQFGDMPKIEGATSSV